MLKKILLGSAAIVGIATAALVYVAWPFMRGPQFTVVNASDGPVSVEASWRTNTKELGELAADERISFRVRDEAGMTFTASFPDGRQVSSTPVYFTSGTTLEAVITNTEIKIGR